MKTTIIIHIPFFVIFSFFTNYLLGEELLSNEERHAQYEKIVTIILSPNANPEVVNHEIERLEKIYEFQPDTYVLVLSRIVNTLLSDNRSASDSQTNKWSVLIEKLNKKIFSKKTDSIQGKGWQIEAIVGHMTFDPEDLPSEISINRNARVSKILELWQSISNSIEHDWDFNDPENDLQPYWPPASYVGGFKSGQSPDSINDPDVKKEYTEYLEKREALGKKAIDQKQAKDIVREDADSVKKYIIDAYSLRPFTTPELEQLLKDNQVNVAFSKEILEAVKQAEKDAPPPTDYRNWQSKDGLFKAKAKYVSSDDKNVTLEKEDGKQTTIELSVLRDIDQRFVKDKIAQKPEKSSDNTTP